MNDVSIGVTDADGNYRSITAAGTLADALRTLILRLGDQHADDADMQGLVDAVVQSAPLARCACRTT